MILRSLQSYLLQAEKDMKLSMSSAVEDHFVNTGSSIGDVTSYLAFIRGMPIV